jgi:hypothetical protein
MAADAKNYETKTKWMRFPAALLLFFVLNFAVEHTVASPNRVLDEEAIRSSDSEARQQGRWGWWLARGYLMRPRTADIAIFGSSQIGAATFSADAFNLKKDLDCVLHRHMSTLEQLIEKETGHHVETVNLGMGGAMISDAYMLEKTLFKDGQSPSIVILTVSPRDFIDNDLVAPSATDTFKFLAPYVKLDGLEAAAYPETFSRFDWFLNQNIALKRTQQAIQKSLVQTLTAMLPPSNNSEKLTISGAPQQDKKKFLQAISGSAGEVKPGEWVVPSVTPPDLWMDNSREYIHRYKETHPPVYKCEKQFFTALLSDLSTKHIQVLVVEMPSMEMNRKLLPDSFWKEHKSWLAETCTKYGADVYDISDNDVFIKAHYLDTVHLNARGGNMVFMGIAQQIVRNPKLAALVAAAPAHLQPQPKDPDDLGASAAVGSWH